MISKLNRNIELAVAFAIAGLSQPTLAQGVGTPVDADVTVAQEPAYPSNVSAAHDSEGNFGVLWGAPSAVTDSSGNIAAFNYRRMAADGSPLTAVIPIGYSKFPGKSGIGMDAAGDFVAAWNCSDTTTSTATACAQVFNPDGTAKTELIQVAVQDPQGTYSTGISFNSIDVAMNSAGDFVVAMSYVGNFARLSAKTKLSHYSMQYVQARRFHLDGTPIGDAKQLAYQEFPYVWNTTLGHARVIMGSTGEYLVTWINAGFLKGQFFSADGASTSAVKSIPVLTGDNTVRDALPPYSLALNENGDLLIATAAAPTSSDGIETGIYLQKCSNQCRSKQEPVLIGKRAGDGIGLGALSLVPTASGGAVVSWVDGGTHVATAIAVDSDFAPLGSPFTVATDSTPAGVDQNWATLIEPSGNFVAVWGQIAAGIFEGP